LKPEIYEEIFEENARNFDEFIYSLFMNACFIEKILDIAHNFFRKMVGLRGNFAWVEGLTKF